MHLIKWFWTNISFRKWTFEGNKLANPFLIIWRIIIFIPLQISIILAAFVLFIAFEPENAKDLINSFTPFYIE